MSKNQIFEALEAFAPVKKMRRSFQLEGTDIASNEEILAFRDTLIRFLDELDGDLSIIELREALEEYKPNES